MPYHQTRDQRRALHAYACVDAVASASDVLTEYRILVKHLGPAILRDGLAMALAFIERDQKGAEGQRSDARQRAGKRLLEDLAHPDLLGVAPQGPLPAWVRNDLGTMDYMLVTREMLRLAIWFTRALQAMPTPPPTGTSEVRA